MYMFKNFSFFFFFFFPFFVYSMQEEGLHKQQVKNSNFKLVRANNMEPPTKKDIQYYEDNCGKIPEELKNFYRLYGNCSSEKLDILHIYGGESSNLFKATKFIQQYLCTFHALAFDQGAGGYWIYSFSTYPKIELFDTSQYALTEQSIDGLKNLLLK